MQTHAENLQWFLVVWLLAANTLSARLLFPMWLAWPNWQLFRQTEFIFSSSHSIDAGKTHPNFWVSSNYIIYVSDAHDPRAGVYIFQFPQGNITRKNVCISFQLYFYWIFYAGATLATRSLCSNKMCVSALLWLNKYRFAVAVDLFPLLPLPLLSRRSCLFFCAIMHRETWKIIES